MTYLGEGNGNPLHYSCLEYPLDTGVWWAAVHGVMQSRIQLKRPSMHACTGEGNGNPLQYSCLENPRGRGTWWAAVYGVAQSRTRLKRLSSSSMLRESERGEWKRWPKTQDSEKEDKGIWSHHFMANRWRNSGNSERLYALGLQNHCRWWLQPWN